MRRRKRAGDSPAFGHDIDMVCRDMRESIFSAARPPNFDPIDALGRAKAKVDAPVAAG